MMQNTSKTRRMNMRNHDEEEAFPYSTIGTDEAKPGRAITVRVQISYNYFKGTRHGGPFDSQSANGLMVNLLIASPATHCVLRLRRQQGCKEQVSSLRLRQAARNV